MKEKNQKVKGKIFFLIKMKTTYQNLRDAAKAMLIEEFVTLNVYIGKKGPKSI